MNFLKVMISIMCIGAIGSFVKDRTTAEERSFSEIAYAILFAAWIRSGKW